MSLAGEADDGHVAAAFDLFTKSTINAMNAGLINSSTERLEVSVIAQKQSFSAAHLNDVSITEYEQAVVQGRCRGQRKGFPLCCHRECNSLSYLSCVIHSHDTVGNT